MRDKDIDALRYISRVSGKSKIHIVTLLLVQMILGISSVFYALLFRDVIDRAVSHDMDGVIRHIIYIILLVVLQIALSAVVRFVQEFACAGYENAFKKRLFVVLLTKAYGPVTAVHSGEWVNRLTSDTKVVAEGLGTILPGLLEMLTKLIGAAVMIIVIEPRFGLVIFPGGLLLAALTYIFRKKLKKLHKKMQESDGKVRVFFQEHLESLIMIKSYSMEHKSIRQASERMQEHKRARIMKNHFSNVCNVGFAAAMDGAYMLGIVYGAFGIYNGSVSYGTVMALLQLIGQVQMPFANITGYLPRYYAMIASAERLMEAENFSGDAADEFLSADDKKNEPELSDGRTEKLYSANSKIKPESDKYVFLEIGLRGASFSYKDGEKGVTKVFDSFDFHISKGEFVAFTGVSGCGKSTVLKLLMGLYPLEAGERYITFSGGGSGERYADNSYRHLFAYVPQGNLLMSGSIRDIVTFAEDGELAEARKSVVDGELTGAGITAVDEELTEVRISASDREDRCQELIDRALVISCASDFVAELPHGVDTILGERGAGLSEGQMQRLAIARAIYSDRPVLLLDEATSALDEVTEERLLENLRAMTDKTVIIVTHRKAALSVCDRLVRF